MNHAIDKHVVKVLNIEMKKKNYFCDMFVLMSFVFILTQI